MKQQKKTARTKERILNASMQEFGKKGYVQTTINGICTKYDIPKGLIYHNFKGKDNLYLICLEKVYSGFIMFLKEMKEPITMQQYMQRRLDFFSEHPLYARLFFESILHPPENLVMQIKELKKEFDVLNQRIYRASLSEITLRDGVSYEDAMEYYAMMQEMFNAFFSSPAFSEDHFEYVVKSHEEQLARFLDYMVYGLAEKERSNK